MHMLDSFYMPLRSSLRLTRLTFGSLHSLAHMVVLVVDIVRVLGICPGLQEIAAHCLGVDCQLGQITDQFHPACSWVCVPARVLCTPGSLTVCNGCPGAQGLAVQSGPLGVSHCLPVRPTQSFTLLNEWTDVYPAMMCNWTAGATATRASLPWPLPTCVGGVVGVHCRASVLSLWGGGVWCIAEHSGVAVLGCAR